MLLIVDLKPVSIPKVNNDKITVEIDTTAVDEYKSEALGHSTLSLNSIKDSLRKPPSELIVKILHGH
jgi:hypothetical protein